MTFGDAMNRTRDGALIRRDDWRRRCFVSVRRDCTPPIIMLRDNDGVYVWIPTPDDMMADDWYSVTADVELAR